VRGDVSRDATLYGPQTIGTYTMPSPQVCTSLAPSVALVLSRGPFELRLCARPRGRLAMIRGDTSVDDDAPYLRKDDGSVELLWGPRF
jgi:hypothetical protein